MDVPEMDAGKGHLELVLLNSRAVEATEEEFISRLRCRSIPQIVEVELRRMWDQTRVCGGELIHIGRVILEETAAFVEAHPYEDAGAAIGAVVTAILDLVPFLEPLLCSSAITLGELGYHKQYYDTGDGRNLFGEAKDSLRHFATVLHANKDFFPVLPDMGGGPDFREKFAIDQLGEEANPFALEDALALTNDTKTIVRYLIKVAQAEGRFDEAEKQFIRRAVKDRGESISKEHLQELAEEVSAQPLKWILGDLGTKSKEFRERLLFLGILAAASDCQVDKQEKRILAEALSLLAISKQRYSELAAEAVLAIKAQREEGFLCPDTRILVKFLIKMAGAEGTFDVPEKQFVRRTVRQLGETLTNDVFNELMQETSEQSLKEVLAEAEKHPREFKERLLLNGMLLAAADKSVDLWEKRILVDAMKHLGVSKERYAEIAQEAHGTIRG